MKKYFINFLFIVVILIIFRSWFFPGIITGGDFWPYYKSMYPLYSFPLHAWSTSEGNGLGGFAGPFLWIIFNISLPITLLGKNLGFSWDIIERIFYLFPLLLLSIFSSSYLYRKTLAKNNYGILASFIFIFNTYFLMLVGGGQIMGIGLSYAIFPLVLLFFIKNTNQNTKSHFSNLKSSILTGFLFSLQAMFDIRIAYVALFAVGIYFLLNIKYTLSKQNTFYILSSAFYNFVIPLGMTMLLHAFWLLPTLLHGSSPLADLGSAYSSIDAVKFFSFAKLENTISLLHPNWPDNIFGKVSFMKPEFLLLPILAYSSLFFVSKNQEPRTKNYILFFALLGLVGAFLAKGAQDPFGGLYIWLFQYIPGFNMFRDSTKWYTLVAVSYSILIPFSIWNIYGILSSKFKVQSSIRKLADKFQINTKNSIVNPQNLFIFLVLSFMLVLIRPALLGQLGGTFKTTSLPPEYIKLEKKLSSDKQFYRTLWLPQIQRFAFFSNNHPAISANDLFKLNSPKDDVNFLKKKSTIMLLQESSVKYIIVPYDSMGELFLTDRKYDKSVYDKTLKSLNTITYLKKIDGFGQIGVYEVPFPKDHFWSPDTNLKISYKYINPVNYQISISGANKTDLLIFAESYDKGWIAKSSNLPAGRQGSMNRNGLNSFILPKDGNYSVEIYYQPQKWVDIGTIISSLSFVTILISLILIKGKEKK